MNRLLSGISIGLFWASWPAQYVYFRLVPERSRVLVIVQDEFLAVRPWLSPGDYILPGGGKKRHESILRSAVRELKEETGISAPESSLKLLGKRRHSQNGLSYSATHYVLLLSVKPAKLLKSHEIIDSRWLKLTNTGATDTGNDVKHALKRYKPLTQAELL